MATPNLKLELMDSNVLQPSVPFNAAMQILDVVAQLTVQAFALSPPATTAGDAGKVWIVQGGATGAFVGKDNQLAVCTGANLWAFVVPSAGWRADLATVIYRYSGSAWNIVTTGGFYVPGFISGLNIAYKSAHVVTISAGTAHNQSSDTNYRQDSAVDVTIPSTASTWFYLYQYGNNLIEQSTTAPYTVPYVGRAMSKGGDTTRRYLGAVLNNSSGNLLNFLQVGDEILWQEQTDLAPFRALTAGTATTKTSVPLGSFAVPAGCRSAKLAITNLGTDRALVIGNPNCSTYISGIRQLSGVLGFFPLDSSQNVSYNFAVAAPASGAAYIDIVGYMLER